MVLLCFNCLSDDQEHGEYCRTCGTILRPDSPEGRKLMSGFARRRIDSLDLFDIEEKSDLELAMIGRAAAIAGEFRIRLIARNQQRARIRSSRKPPAPFARKALGFNELANAQHQLSFAMSNAVRQGQPLTDAQNIAACADIGVFPVPVKYGIKLDKLSSQSANPKNRDIVGYGILVAGSIVVLLKLLGY
jgi:hypothetical protein